MSLYFFEFSVGIGAFVIGMRQIASFSRKCDKNVQVTLKSAKIWNQEISANIVKIEFI